MDGFPTALLTSGGITGLLVVAVYLGRLLLDWRKTKDDARATMPRAIADAETANALLLSALKEEREDNRRLAGQVEELQVQNSLLWDRLRAQRREYEAEVSELRAQLSDFQQRLEDFQRRIHERPE